MQAVIWHREHKAASQILQQLGGYTLQGRTCRTVQGGAVDGAQQMCLHPLRGGFVWVSGW